MSWTWTYENAEGATIHELPPAATTEAFDTKADAEAWLGDSFAALLDGGVDQVTLLESGAIAYSMSLHPADD